MRVLVVDDNIVLLQNIARHLSGVGYAVEAAMNLAQAREILDATPVGLICLDLQLTDGHGLDLLEEVRAKNPSLPAIVMSGDYTPANRARAAHLGAVTFLPKPFALTKLNSLIENHSTRNACGAHHETINPNVNLRPTKTMEA